MSHDYCADQVRLYDYESYVLILFAPAAKREALYAIHAFRIELSRIKGLIREPMMGLIRIQWWRDAIEKLYQGEVLRHEVLQALAPVIKKYALSSDDFTGLIDSYESDLELFSYESLSQIKEQAIKKSLPLLHMECVILGKNIADDLLTVIGAGDVLSTELMTDHRLKSYKEHIKIELIQLIKSAAAIRKNAIISLRLPLIKRRMKAVETGMEMPHGTLAFYLWLRSL